MSSERSAIKEVNDWAQSLKSTFLKKNFFFERSNTRRFLLTEFITNLGSLIGKMLSDPNDSLTNVAEAVALPFASRISHNTGIVVWGVYQVIF